MVKLSPLVPGLEGLTHTPPSRKGSQTQNPMDLPLGHSLLTPVLEGTVDTNLKTQTYVIAHFYKHHEGYEKNYKG